MSSRACFSSSSSAMNSSLGLSYKNTQGYTDRSSPPPLFNKNMGRHGVINEQSPVISRPDTTTTLFAQSDHAHSCFIYLAGTERMTIWTLSAHRSCCNYIECEGCRNKYTSAWPQRTIVCETELWSGGPGACTYLSGRHRIHSTIRRSRER